MTEYIYPHYDLAASTAIQVLEDYGISQVPVSFQPIFDALSNELRLMSYQQLQQDLGLPFIDDVSTMFGSAFGACVYYPESEEYIIYYNLLESTSRRRFTVAHELGHYFLEHHRKAKTNILTRTYISQEEYDVFEKEANVFARNLLSPAPLATQYIDGKQTFERYRDIEAAFKITEQAAEMRILFHKRDLRDYDEHMTAVCNHIKILYGRFCSTCYTKSNPDGRYCEICGGRHHSYGFEYYLLPDAIPTNEKGHFISCPRCHNNDISADANYCRICGLPLSNPCLSEDTPHYNNSYAEFCKVCHQPTLYGQLHAANEGRYINMKYTDGVPYDESTNRIKICPCCKNEEFSEYAKYCRICGADLYNTCVGLELHDEYGQTYTGERHSNPSNARFCETCGAETAFYVNQYLKPFQNYIPPETQEWYDDKMHDMLEDPGEQGPVVGLEAPSQPDDDIEKFPF